LASVTAAVTRPFGGSGFAAAIALPPLILIVAHVLPEDGLGLAIRLAAATACILVVPGALVTRALGWPSSPGVAAAGALVWSLVIVFAALVVTFATSSSLRLTLVTVAAATAASVVPAFVADPPWPDRAERRAVLWLLAGSVLLAGAVWYANRAAVSGDALFHLARVRKLDEFGSLSLNGVGEFRDGGLHPGYAFPLWHGALALVANIAGVDPALVVQHVAAVLTPLAVVVAYGAGAVLFRSWGGGVAVALAQVAQLGFARAGTGSFGFLALPASAARVLLFPALLALFFAAIRTEAPRGWLASVAAAALVLAVVHPTYVLFAGILLAGFAGARLLLTPAPGALRLGLGLAAIAVPAGIFIAWLLPVVRDTIPYLPSAAQRVDDFKRYRSQLDGDAGSFRLAPETIARGGAVTVAGLLAVPLAAFFGRRRVGALILGGTILLLALLLVPALFTRFADAVSLSQARRLAQFLPIPFALAAAAFLAGRYRRTGVLAALGAGIALQVAYPGEFNYGGGAGPAYPVWIAFFGGIVGLAAAAFRRREPVRPATPAWAAAALAAFVLPVAVAGLADLPREVPTDPYALTPDLIRELRELPTGDVVFGNLESSYRAAAYAPVYIAAAPPAHVARTTKNHPYERRVDVVRFFNRPGVSDARRRAILRRYGADWLLVDRTRRYPRSFVESLLPRYEDARFTIFRVPR
jgi:uncharacterized protein DUF6541